MTTGNKQDVTFGDWLWALFALACLLGAFAFLADSCEAASECEARGGVVVRGYQGVVTCIRRDAVEDLR